MIVGILLAAGASSRFGGDKLLYPLPDGSTLGVASARSLRGGVDRALAVVRPQDRTLISLLQREGLDILPCPPAAGGMGHSISCGVGAAPDADGWVVALADMPFIQARTIGTVAKLLRGGASLVAPVCDGRRGHPVGFGRPFFDALRALTGDTGARHLLETHADQLTGISCDDRGVLIDIDSPQDLARWMQGPGDGRAPG